MPFRFVLPRAAALSRATLPSTRSTVASSRTFTSSRPCRETVVAAQPVPVKRPVGAFRGGLFGFLLGVTLAGASAYYYVIDEYKLSNDMLTEDIYSLQASVQRLHDHVTELENKSAQSPK